MHYLKLVSCVGEINHLHGIEFGDDIFGSVA